MSAEISAKNGFFVAAIWDDEAKLFYSKINIKGLAIEAATVEEFEEVMKEFVPELILKNHARNKNLDHKPIRESLKPCQWLLPPSEIPSLV